MRLSVRSHHIYYALMLWQSAVVLWMLNPQTPTVFLLWLVAGALLALRLRFKVATKGWVFEGLLWLLIVFLDVNLVWIGLPFALNLMALGHPAGVLFYGGFVAVALSQPWVLLMVLFSLISGFILHRWRQQEHRTHRIVDELREQLYQLNQENTTLLESIEEQTRLSMLTERDRIARQLHDDLGHELTGGLLALRAYESVVPESQTHPSFLALKSRLESSLTSLKATVHGTKPEEALAYERFKTLLENFPGPSIEHITQGNLDRLTPEVWSRLLAVLKEALTNVLKHAHPTMVQVTLEVLTHRVRLSVKNDRPKDVHSQIGFGLRAMRRRVEVFGGSLSVVHAYEFELICVLPLHREGGHDETIVGG